eukprot:TRINITY_DN2339_c0_g4_i1.p1 TRINITY_DN2339_c0_g4~~TRINITY_DN2339_c0_g4_i1.p1  ORF type:complete len:656 (-),score=82.87 TRINITY_DN2339_c0_g4_i1:50-1864(-)
MLLHMLRVCWEKAVETSCADGSPVTHDRVVHSLHMLQTYVERTESLVQSAWWECIREDVKRERKVLQSLQIQLKENCARLNSVIGCFSQEAVKKRDENFMRQVEGALQRVLDESCKLMWSSTQAACAGHVGPESYDINPVEKAIVVLTKLFNAVSVSHPDTDIMSESAICLHMCAFGRGACLHAEACQLLAKAECYSAKQRFRGALDRMGFWRTIDTSVLDSQRLRFILSSTLTIMVAFIIGGWCNVKGVNDPYDAGISSTVVVLAGTKHIGTAMIKNLDRTTGVILGTVFGEVLFGLFGCCSFWGYLLLSICLFNYMLATLLMYFHSPRYQYVGCLFAAFGVQKMIMGCTYKAQRSGYASGVYSSSVDCILAIVIMTAMAFVTQTESEAPSAQATDALEKAMQGMRIRTAAFFNLVPTADVETQDPVEVSSCLQRAKTAGAQAADEPRLWKPPWRSRLFDEVLDTMQNMCIVLDTIEYVVADNKRVAMDVLRSNKSIQRHASMLLTRMDKVHELLAIFVNDCDDRDDSVFSGLIVERGEGFTEDMQQMKRALLEQSMSALQEDVLPGSKTLEANAMCQVLVIYSNMEAMGKQLENLQHAILSS